MVKYLILLFSIGLIGCNASRRASRLVAKAERLDPNVLVSDTVVYYDTVVTNRYDTIITNRIVSFDTVVVMNTSKAVIKYYYNDTTKVIEHEIKIPSDTVFVEVEVPITKARIVKPWYDWSNPWIYLIAFALIIVITKNKK